MFKITLTSYRISLSWNELITFHKIQTEIRRIHLVILYCTKMFKWHAHFPAPAACHESANGSSGWCKMTEIFTDKMGIHVYQSRNELLGTFALSRKGPTTFIMSIHPLCVPPPIYRRGSHWTDCREIWYWGLLRKFVDTFKILWKSGKNIKHVTWRP